MKTVLLVIDVQELITTPALFGFERFVGNLKMLIAAARESGTEIVFVRHDDGPEAPLSAGKPGFDIYRETAPLPGERVFDKTVNSPFRGTGLLGYLREKEVKRLIVTGLQTDYCIDAAVKSGFEHGFEMIVPQYANSTVDNRFMTAETTYDYYNNFIWKNRYAECIPSEDAAAMMKRG